MLKRLWNALRAAGAAFAASWAVGRLTAPKAGPTPTQRVLGLSKEPYVVTWAEPGGNVRRVQTSDGRTAVAQYRAVAADPNRTANLYAYGRHTDHWETQIG